MNKIWFIALLIMSCEHQSSTYNEGKKTYSIHCEHCHMKDGKGFEELYPPLANSDALTTLEARIACIIRNGIEGEMTVNGKVYNMAMPENKTLNAIEITNVINYINNSWGNELGFTSLESIKRNLQECK